MNKQSKNLPVTRKSFLRLLALTVMSAFIIFPVKIDAQGSKADFSGTWTLNEAKSTLPQGGGGGQRMIAREFTVTQAANLLTQTRPGQDGTPRATKYALDGTETVNALGEFESKSTAKWSTDGKSLTITTKSNFNGNERTSTAVWTLTDAKTLSIVSTRQGQNGEVKTTLVYDKK